MHHRPSASGVVFLGDVSEVGLGCGSGRQRLGDVSDDQRSRPSASRRRGYFFDTADVYGPAAARTPGGCLNNPGTDIRRTSSALSEPGGDANYSRPRSGSTPSVAPQLGVEALDLTQITHPPGVLMSGTVRVDEDLEEEGSPNSARESSRGQRCTASRGRGVASLR